KPARRRRPDPLPRRRIEVGNGRRRARQPLRLRQHGPQRTRQSAGSIRQTDARKRPPPAALLAGAPGRPGSEAELRGKSTESFRGDAKHRTTVRNCAPENLEIPRCAIAHLRSGANAPSRNDGLEQKTPASLPAFW